MAGDGLKQLPCGHYFRLAFSSEGGCIRCKADRLLALAARIEAARDEARDKKEEAIKQEVQRIFDEAREQAEKEPRRGGLIIPERFQ
jgi:predicted  nucleic acid-binding Zn-ribbon protein